VKEWAIVLCNQALIIAIHGNAVGGLGSYPQV
jgi:hypothetical protein